MCRKWTFPTVFYLVTGILSQPCLQSRRNRQFSDRNTLRPDAAEAINTVVNARLREGVDKANLLERANAFDRVPDAICNTNTLYTELQQGHFSVFHRLLGLKGYSLDQQMREALVDYSVHRVVSDSIYRDFSYLDAPSLKLKGLSDVVWLNRNLIDWTNSAIFCRRLALFRNDPKWRALIERCNGLGREQRKVNSDWLPPAYFPAMPT